MDVGPNDVAAGPSELASLVPSPPLVPVASLVCSPASPVPVVPVDVDSQGGTALPAA
ncbi:hypothetical protein OV203_10730 [Nannocystis sp. ILAH1]|uniref:hypothetical protein n=1 Tax=Nannocystis sp. ILAH1 TaxID=2996789 RepID=UPI00226E032A|nr:hypothetical protein [Nannocystis sp. ILAH1]MCY0987601.1 hypothetical protein [Nannocystis sp. ILAH1]